MAGRPGGPATNMTAIASILFGEQHSVKRERLEALLASIEQVDASIKHLNAIAHGSAFRQAAYWLDHSIFNVDWRSGLWRGHLRLSALKRALADFGVLTSQRIATLKEARAALIVEVGHTVMSQGEVITHAPMAVILKDDDIARLLFRPSWVYRVLMPAAGYAILAYACLRLGMRMEWGKLWRAAGEVYSAGHHLLQDWVVTPMGEIWRTVRYRDSNLALASSAALQADINSLERMVVDFASRQYPEIPEETVLSQVRQGDVTLLLRRYEEQLRSPIKNILVGDLVGMLLIQVQKSKVDLESAMMAMDKLLRANELNFELLAIIPLLSLLYFCARLGWRWIGQLARLPDEHRLAAIRQSLHNVERTLNQPDPEPASNLGSIVVLGDSIMRHWSYLSSPLRSKYEAEFRTDLAEVLSSRINNEHKLWTITRMFHFYSFLHPCRLHSW